MTSGFAHDLGDTTDPAELVTRLIDLPSESFAEAALADVVERRLRRYQHLVVERLGNVVVARTELGRTDRVVIAGHLDTVPENQNLPHKIVGENIFGLGATDMKGGLAVMLCLAAGLAEPRHDVTYFFYDCEEVDSQFNGLAKVASDRPELLECEIAILMEPSNAVVEAGCQGSLRADVVARGKRAHSARAWMGDNAIHNATEVLERLTRYQPQRVMIEGLEYREGLNAVLVAGGVAGNVIPDECRVTVNYRYAPSLSPDQAELHLRAVFEGFEVEVKDNAAGAMPGMNTRIAHELLELVGPGNVHPKLGWTDVSRFAALGIPALNFGPGDPTLAHTRDEFVTGADLRETLATLTQLLT